MQNVSKVAVVVTALALTLAACSGAKNAANQVSTAASSAAGAAGNAAGAAKTAAGNAAGAASGAAAAAKNKMTNVASAANGMKVFETNCSSCHGATGKGSPGAFPPLAGNATVVGNATNVIHIVKHGLTGKIVVEGHSYNGQMPPWGTSLSNADIASVITYIRSSWGNKASAVTEAQVAAVK